MPSESIKPGLRFALRVHEIGSESPYQLFFAAKGKSGASFGFMQGDLAAGQATVTRTFRRAMSAAGMNDGEIASLLKRLSIHLVKNPLSAGETKRVNNALLASRDLVDAMDEEICQGVYQDLDICLKRAAEAGRSVTPKAQIYMALWINMSGPPTKILIWLAGGDPELPRPVPGPGPVVDAMDMEVYLQATHYYRENPGNWQHMLSSAAAGAAILDGANTAPVASAARMVRGDGFDRIAAALSGPAPGGSGETAGNEPGEFANVEVNDVFTTELSWLREPMAPAVARLLFAGAATDEFDAEAFSRHIQSLGLTYFQPSEFLYLGASHYAGACRGRNALPPKELWPSISRTARMLDQIRARLGAPIRILSAYRSPGYNTCIGGKRASYHMKFNAIDWTCTSGTVAQWHEVAREVRAGSKEFLGGIGVYPAKRFIHVDTRGFEANWSGAS